MGTFYLNNFGLFFLKLEMDHSFVWSELNWERILISGIYIQLGNRCCGTLFSIY